MLSALQIMALLGLLAAFNVPQPTIDIVDGILHGQHATTTITIAPQQTFGATVNAEPIINVTTQEPMADKSALNVSVIKSSEQDFGVWSLRVSVLDAKGKQVKDAPVHIDGSDNTYPNDLTNPNTNRITNHKTAEGWDTGFDYIPTKDGAHSITVTSGELMKTIEL